MYYSVGNLHFQIPSYGTYERLSDAPSARAYYLPISKTLLKVEYL